MKLINQKLLQVVSKEAQENPRLRMNFNFHDSLHAPVQRLLNALEPGTQLPIHRHRHADETYILLKGSLTISFYDGQAKLLESVLLDRREGSYGVHIRAGEWHSLEVRSPGTVIFEVKEGPYAPLEAIDVLS